MDMAPLALCLCTGPTPQPRTARAGREQASLGAQVDVGAHSPAAVTTVAAERPDERRDARERSTQNSPEVSTSCETPGTAVSLDS